MACQACRGSNPVRPHTASVPTGVESRSVAIMRADVSSAPANVSDDERGAPLETVKKREPTPSLRPAESTTDQLMVWSPFVRVLVLSTYEPMAPRCTSRLRKRVGFDVRVVFSGCGVVLPKRLAMSSLQ